VSPSGVCALGHTRLRVIDLEGGAQPMSDPDTALTVVFNGEIYNYRELRAELVDLGHTFRTASDTEVLLRGWSEWGTALLPRLEGMFAFGIWDEGSGELTLARDRTGQKPLHFVRVDDERGARIVFASEPAALEQLAGGEIDPGALAEWLAIGWVSPPATLVRGLEALPPAHYIVCTPDGMSEPVRWWRYAPVRREVARDEAVRRIRELLTQAVERRRVADVPLGALLSGGVDSTAMVALLQAAATRDGDPPVRTFSIGFDDPVYDEGEWAELAAERLGTVHTHRTVAAPGPEVIAELVEVWGLPFADSSALPTWIVSGVAREEVTVALTGDGGDELFAGYWRMHAVGMAERVPRMLAAPAAALARALPAESFRSPARRAARLLDAARLSPHARLAEWVGVFGQGGRGLLREELRTRLDPDAWLRGHARAWGDAAPSDPLTGALAATFETYLPEDLLVKADRASMAHGLELRSPFLDRDLIEYCASLPSELHRRSGRLKALLKDAVADLVPAEILDRPKQGFGVPLPRWLRGPWRDFVEVRLRDSASPLWMWLDRAAVGEVVADHMDRDVDREHGIWSLLVLDAWLRKRA
jgi:asparagine synthase (glutamine-hydrolysing)